MLSRIGKASQLQLYKIVKIHINTGKKKKKRKVHSHFQKCERYQNADII